MSQINIGHDSEGWVFSSDNVYIDQKGEGEA